jgi:hypothetical protein
MDRRIGYRDRLVAGLVVMAIAGIVQLIRWILSHTG